MTNYFLPGLWSRYNTVQMALHIMNIIQVSAKSATFLTPRFVEYPRRYIAYALSLMKPLTHGDLSSHSTHKVEIRASYVGVVKRVSYFAWGLKHWPTIKDPHCNVVSKFSVRWTAEQWVPLTIMRLVVCLGANSASSDLGLLDWKRVM